jgi:hypothetical protein
MRSIVMKGLTAAMCGGALVAFGVAAAGEHTNSVTNPPAGYRVVQTDARISPLTTLSGFRVVDDDTLLLNTSSGPYLADLIGPCARGAEYDWQIAVDSPGGGGIDRFSQVLINHRRCGISALVKLERVREHH